MKKQNHIAYTAAHRRAFRYIEKRLLGYNTIRGVFHDIDKIILYHFFDNEKVHDFHVKHARHHNRARTRADYIQMVIDWECARFTKPDKPLNARQTLEAYYPHLKNEILPILAELGL